MIVLEDGFDDLRASDLERAFDTHFRALGHDLPRPENDYRFAPPRQFRFDRAWPDYRVAVELEGAKPRTIVCHNCGVEVRMPMKGGGLSEPIRMYGWHQRFSRWKSDREKYNLAISEGWDVLRFINDDVYGDPFSMVELIRQVMERRHHRIALTDSLSPREDEILHLIAAGMTGPEIADRLGLGEMTVRSHAQGIRTKLLSRNRAASVARAFAWGLLDLKRIPWPDETPEMLAFADEDN